MIPVTILQSPKKWVFLLLIVFTAITFFGGGWYTFSSYKHFEVTDSQHHRIIELNGIITHLDEVLTMSARMAAATGELKWEDRYRKFEHQLDDAINEVKRLAPGGFMSQAAAETDAANIKLVAIENQSFDLVRQGNLQAAAQLLYSQEYENQKRFYNEGMRKYITALQNQIEGNYSNNRQMIMVGVISVSFLGSLIFFSVIAILQMQKHLLERKRMQRKLEVNNQQLTANEQQLRAANQQLDTSNQQLQSEITERKQAEEQVRSERNFAENIVNTAQTIILVLDTEGRIVRFNPYMEELAGYRAEEVKGKDWFSCFLPERDHERIRERFLKAIGDIQTCGNVNPVVTKDGREREIEWYDKTIKDVEGKTIGLLAIGQDVTERLENEEKLNETLAEIERFNKLMMGREGRVIEMKKEVNALLAELGREPQYKSVLENETVVSSDKAE